MVSQSLAPSSELPPNVRATDPSRDLAAVAHIIEVAFADEILPGTSHVTRELRLLNAVGPLVRYLALALPLFGDLLTGYVWESPDGVVAGNITVSATDLGSRHWIISNVGVLPDFRRQGIARALMEAAIRHVRTRGGSRITLQVRYNNPAAKDLYAQLGFHIIDTFTELYAETLRPTQFHEPISVSVARPDGSRWYEAYEVARAAIPPRVQALRPLRPAAFRHREPGFFERWWEWLTGSPRERWWAEVDGNVAGLLTMERRVSGVGAHIEILVDPRSIGLVEGPLVNKLSHQLRHERQARATVAAHLTDVRAKLAEAGFRELRTLDQMVLELYA